jgi:uncharacterized Zn-binding protein involved in type VI secretion
MPFAARIADLQTCLMRTGPIPHGRGPFLGPGVSMLWIGGKRAACLGDSCACVGPPAGTVNGSTSGFSGTQTAARQSDTSIDSATILLAFPTILIGD